MAEEQTESILDVDLGDAQELELMDEGEAKSRISRADIVENKSNPGRRNLRVVIDSPDNKLVDDVYQYIVVPEKSWQEADPKGYVRAVNRMKDFAECYGVNVAGGEVSRMVGAEGWVDWGQEMNDRTGRMQNTIRRFIPPKKGRK